MKIVTLADARDPALFGSKAVGLGQAIRDGLPTPPGVALCGSTVEAVASGDRDALDMVLHQVERLDLPLAVRSSAADEDGAQASFAGQHLTLLNISSLGQIAQALSDVWWSANSDSAITYRQRVGLFMRPYVGVVIQSLLDPDAAGVMFTRNPVNGSDQRMIEASWGLGEAVVAGIVIPDHFVIDARGAVVERKVGHKKIRIRSVPDGGTIEEPVAAELVEKPCIEDRHLAALGELASHCEQLYGPGRDIEWARCGEKIFILQCRAITR